MQGEALKKPALEKGGFCLGGGRQIGEGIIASMGRKVVRIQDGAT